MRCRTPRISFLVFVVAICGEYCSSQRSIPFARSSRGGSIKPTAFGDSVKMLLPNLSSTALLCEPVFTDYAESAIWYKDGKKIATVDRLSNALYMDRPYHSDQPMPKMGFLLISNITREDEGIYHCHDAKTDFNGSYISLRVAFVGKLPEEGYIRMSPSQPVMGETITLDCEPPEAMPAPTVSWMLNGVSTQVAVPDSTAYPNGTLVIRRFSLRYLGLITCTIENYAEKQHTGIFLDARSLFINRETDTPSTHEYSPEAFRCSLFFRASVLWFLIGCLSTWWEFAYLHLSFVVSKHTKLRAQTQENKHAWSDQVYGCYCSCGVLMYLLCALICLRPGARNRLTLRPMMFLRSHPTLGPGFRKPIRPMPDIYIAPSNSGTANLVTNSH